MDDITKELNQYARRQLVPLRPELISWELIGGAGGREIVVEYKTAKGGGRTTISLPPGNVAGDAILKTVRGSMKRLWPRLAEWARLSNGTLRIAYTYADAFVGTIEVDMPAADPQPELTDDA